MEHLIDKSALVAEIEKRREESWLGHYTKEKGIVFDITDEILSFINTLEVKEVDLEKELSTYLEVVKAADEDIDFVDFAKHFFELGLKAQKGEKV